MAEYGLSFDEAVSYLNKGADGAPPPIEATFEQRVGLEATSARVHLSFEAWMSERSILQAVRMVQDFVLGHDRENRLMSGKVAMVVEWVELCRSIDPAQTFRSIAAEWNHACQDGRIPRDWHYSNPDMLSRDYHRGEKQLMRTRYFDVHPDDTSGLRRTKFLPVSWSRDRPPGSRRTTQR
jgi:hypothetical protein